MGFWLGVDSSMLSAQCTPFPSGHNLDEALDGTDYWECPHTHEHSFVLDLGVYYLIHKVKGRSNTAKDPLIALIEGSLNGTDFYLLKEGVTDWQDTTTFNEHITAEEICKFIRIILPATEDDRFQYLEFGGNPAFTIFDAYVSYAPGMIGASSDGGGWRMLSIGGDLTVNKTDLQFLYNGTYYTWTEATTNDNEEGEPLVDFWFYGWNYSNQIYENATTLNSWLGYWHYHYYDVQVYYPIQAGDDGAIILLPLRKFSI